jgi:hypothetical protein
MVTLPGDGCTAETLDANSRHGDAKPAMAPREPAPDHNLVAGRHRSMSETRLHDAKSEWQCAREAGPPGCPFAAKSGMMPAALDRMSPNGLDPT